MGTAPACICPGEARGGCGDQKTGCWGTPCSVTAIFFWSGEEEKQNKMSENNGSTMTHIIRHLNVQKPGLQQRKTRLLGSSERNPGPYSLGLLPPHCPQVSNTVSPIPEEQLSLPSLSPRLLQPSTFLTLPHQHSVPESAQMLAPWGSGLGCTKAPWEPEFNVERERE